MKRHGRARSAFFARRQRIYVDYEVTKSDNTEAMYIDGEIYESE